VMLYRPRAATDRRRKTRSVPVRKPPEGADQAGLPHGFKIISACFFAGGNAGLDLLAYGWTLWLFLSWIPSFFYQKLSAEA